MKRQFLQPEDRETIEELCQALIFADFVPIIIFLLPLLTGGSLLPSWIFIHSLQIITHMVLLQTIMPVHAYEFLSTWNNWLRWYDEDLLKLVAGNIHDLKEYDIDEGTYHPILLLANY